MTNSVIHLPVLILMFMRKTSTSRTGSSAWPVNEMWAPTCLFAASMWGKMGNYCFFSGKMKTADTYCHILKFVYYPSTCCWTDCVGRFSSVNRLRFFGIYESVLSFFLLHTLRLMCITLHNIHLKYHFSSWLFVNALKHCNNPLQLASSVDEVAFLELLISNSPLRGTTVGGMSYKT